MSREETALLCSCSFAALWQICDTFFFFFFQQHAFIRGTDARAVTAFNAIFLFVYIPAVPRGQLVVTIFPY